MKHLRWCLLAVALLAGLECAPADSILTPTPNLDRVNKRLFGVIVDYTHNHGKDRRIWSPALCERRDLYVYLPPGFDPRCCYPLAICLHGATQDERFFLGAAVEQFDQAIMCGKLPPVILAVPDGSYHGRRSLCKPATFFANSKLGNFEDYLMGDVWNFMMCNYPILPEREAHALVGVSMGGGAAFALGMKHRDRISVVIGLHPVLNLRWLDCHGRYRGNFDPDCWAWRTQTRPFEPMGHKGFVTLSFGQVLGPMYGRDAGAVWNWPEINPIELLDSLNVRPGELDMYIAYGGRDEFNIDAQVESFLFRACQRGLDIGVGYDPKGKHDEATGIRLFPGAMAWAAPRIPPPRPCGVGPPLGPVPGMPAATSAWRPASRNVPAP
jgi:pimeloyl-ACP methyl ester carboxylesterase